MKLEDEFLDVLQNIEFGIAEVYRQHQELKDRDVLQAVEALIRHYAAEERRQKLIPRAILSATGQKVFDRVNPICDWRLGKPGAPAPDGEAAHEKPISHADLLRCLKRIRESIETWSSDGSRGYLNFVRPFLNP